MRKCKCRKCGCEFTENDANPAVHYSTPEDLCFHCKVELMKLTEESKKGKARKGKQERKR